MMIRVPGYAPSFTEEYRHPNGIMAMRDPETGILNRSDRDETPHGIINGYVWTTYLQWLPQWLRQKVYDAVRAEGWTHVVLHVGKSAPDAGYHGLRPTTPEEADSFGERSNVVFRELTANGLIAIGVGVSPEWPVAPGFDTSQIRVAMTDYDNTRRAAERIDAISKTFPEAFLFYERPGPDQDHIEPEYSGYDPVRATPHNGGQWIAGMQQRYPRFVGLLLELNGWEGVDACVAEIERIYPFYRDLYVSLFEQFTYDEFWNNTPDARVRSVNDEILRRCPYIQGRFGGATAVPPPAAGGHQDTHGGTVGEDQIDINEVWFVGVANLRTFPKTADIWSVTFGLSDIIVSFSRQDGPDRWSDVPFGEGNVQYSLGLGFKVDGVWYASAPVELWHGKPGGGGPIMSQDIGDGRGQIAANWFYDHRWEPLTGKRFLPGTEGIFFLVAGDPRNGVFAQRERSNIIRFNLPEPNQSLTLSFA